MQRGRFISSVDNRNAWNVAVLSTGVAERMFKYQDPLGKPILLGEDVYRVIGILGSSSDASGQEDANEEIYIPLSCAQRRFRELKTVRSSGSFSAEKTQLSEITLKVTDSDVVSQTAAMARKILLTSHPKEDDFRLTIPLELLRRAEEEKRIWNLVLGSIAGISLLVGGIGIMNIMLANVTESLGRSASAGRSANHWDITVQFLVET